MTPTPRDKTAPSLRSSLLALADRLTRLTDDGLSYSKFCGIDDELRSLAATLPATPATDNGQGLDYTPGWLDLTAPARIWLQVDTSADNSDRDESWPCDDGVSWCHESVGGLEVQYVRADLAANPPAAGAGGSAVWVGVGPVNPTPMMIQAGARARQNGGTCEEVYRAMLAVAPAAPVSGHESALPATPESAEPVAWTIVGPDGVNSVGDNYFSYKKKHEILGFLSVRAGHRVEYAYTHPTPATSDGEVARLGLVIQELQDTLTKRNEELNYLRHAKSASDGTMSANAKHWHDLYRAECRARQDDAARCGQEIIESDQWREAVLDELAITHVHPPSDTPRDTLKAIIAWHVQCALNPQVSASDGNELRYLAGELAETQRELGAWKQRAQQAESASDGGLREDAERGRFLIGLMRYENDDDPESGKWYSMAWLDDPIIAPNGSPYYTSVEQIIDAARGATPPTEQEATKEPTPAKPSEPDRTRIWEVLDDFAEEAFREGRNISPGELTAILHKHLTALPEPVAAPAQESPQAASLLVTDAAAGVVDEDTARLEYMCAKGFYARRMLDTGFYMVLTGEGDPVTGAEFDTMREAIDDVRQAYPLAGQQKEGGR